MTQKAYQKVTIISELQNALSHNEFEVYFQPQIDSTTEQTIGLEALCRWNHPTKGIILPSEFIKIAINNGIIIDIDKFIMRESMKTYARWHKEGKNPGTLSLNLTIDNIMNDGFIPYIKTCLQEFNFDPHNLVLELIESEIMQKHTKIIEKLEQLSKMGISISIDDFGIGYSSLAYLKRLPIQKLKIDHSFISNIPQDINDSYIVKAIIALASSLNIDIIAEGVETIQQKEFLEENGCNRIQGFYYAKPMSIRDIEQKIL
jgi:EAL domain-containing protein (putative c-di-GMP-specific phosphodiesterase class I)